MEITLTLPDDLAERLAAASGDLSQTALEALAVEGYRQGNLSAFEVRQILGHESRWETEDFLAAHDAWPGLTEEDLSEELKAIQRFQ